MKKFFNKFYHIFVIVAVAVVLIGIRKMAVNTSSTKPVKHVASMVKINQDRFEEALCDTCEYSRGTLTCPEGIIKKIAKVRGEDGKEKSIDSLKEVTNESITFYKDGNYIDVPATVLVKMIDAGLFNNTSEKK